MKIAGDFPKIVSVLALRVTSDLQTVFFYCSPTAGVPLICNKIRQIVFEKNPDFTLKIVFLWGLKNDNILSSKSYTVTKSEISP